MLCQRYIQCSKFREIGVWGYCIQWGAFLFEWVKRRVLVAYPGVDSLTAGTNRLLAISSENWFRVGTRLTPLVSRKALAVLLKPAGHEPASKNLHAMKLDSGIDWIGPLYTICAISTAAGLLPLISLGWGKREF